MRTRFGVDDEEAFFATRDALVESYLGAVEGPEDPPDGFVASTMLDYKWGYGDGHITRWRRVDIEDLLLGFFPRKVTLDEEDLLHVVPDAADFLSFLDRQGLLRGDPLPDLQATARGFVPAFVDAMSDPANFGMAKGLFGQLDTEGVDIEDEAAVQHWLDDPDTRLDTESDESFGSDGIEPAAFPPIDLPPRAELEVAARASAPLARLTAFAKSVGGGRKLTQKGYLTLADARELVTSLGTGDTLDGRIGEHVFRTRSSAELPVLDHTFRWARAAGFVKVRHRRVSTTKRGDALGSDPLQDWGLASDGLVKLESAGTGEDPRTFLGWDDAVRWLAEWLPVALYGGSGLAADRLQEIVWNSIEADYLVSSDPSIREGQRTVVGHAVDRIVDPFVELGAIAVTDGKFALTPLGLWGTNRWLRAKGEIAPVVGELADAGAAELLAACAEMPLEVAEQEIRAWIEARPETATSELAEVAHSGALPMMALHALSFAGPGAEAEVRAMLKGEDLRPQALLWLVGNGFEDASALSPETMRSLLVETLAVQVDAAGPIAAVAHFQGLGPEDEQIAMLEGLLHAEHPRTSELLGLIGRHHPTKAVAKAARKTAFRRGSFGPS